MASRERTLAYIAFLMVCLLWGTTYLGIKVSLETVPPFLLGGLRFLTAGTLLTLVLRLRGVRLPPVASWPTLALVGLLLLGVGNGGVIIAEQSVSSGLAAVVVALTPFWMVGIESLLPGGERLTRRVIGGLVLGFTGVLLLARPDLGSGAVSNSSVAGLLILQVASIGWATGTVVGKRRVRDQNLFAASAVQMLVAGAAMTVIGTALGEWQVLTFTPRSAAAMTYLTTAGSLGFACYVYALRHLPVSTVSLYAYANPVIAVLLGALALGEQVTLTMIAAMGLILVGMPLVSLRKRATGRAIAGSDPTTRERAA